MKKPLTTLLFLSMFLYSSGQTVLEYLGDDYLKKHWHVMSLTFAAGACDGQVETIKYHYKNFKAVFPSANDQFWNPSLSHKNKWRDGDYIKGEAFPMSSTFFVWTTDSYHMLRSGKKLMLMTAIVIPICGHDGKKFKHYFTDFIVYSVCYASGFSLMYDIIYR